MTSFGHSVIDWALGFGHLFGILVSGLRIKKAPFISGARNALLDFYSPKSWTEEGFFVGVGAEDMLLSTYSRKSGE